MEKIHMLDYWRGGKFVTACGMKISDPPDKPITSDAEKVTCKRCDTARLGRVGVGRPFWR